MMQVFVLGYLFAYLQSEADFQGLRQQLVAQQNEVRTALAGVTL